MVSDERELRRDLSYWASKLMQRRLAAGPGGNISMRMEDVILISPSGFAMDDIQEEDWVPVSLETGETHSKRRPSSEVSLHLELYRQRDDIRAIVHTHPIYCIGVTSANRTVPPMFADFVAILGEVPILEYVLPTSEALADAVKASIGNADAMLLRNHGAITVGSNLKEAYYRTEILEDAAQIYYVSLQVGEPRILTMAECDEIKGLNSEKYRQQLLKNG